MQTSGAPLEVADPRLSADERGSSLFEACGYLAFVLMTTVPEERPWIGPRSGSIPSNVPQYVQSKVRCPMRLPAFWVDPGSVAVKSTLLCASKTVQVDAPNAGAPQYSLVQAPRL
jgi:hypothetical protein